MKSGGTYGCWTLNKVNEYLRKVTTDCVVTEKGNGLKKWYLFTDTFSGHSAVGKTPRLAVANSGMWIPERSFDY